MNNHLLYSIYQIHNSRTKNRLHNSKGVKKVKVNTQITGRHLLMLCISFLMWRRLGLNAILIKLLKLHFNRLTRRVVFLAHSLAESIPTACVLALFSATTYTVCDIYIVYLFLVQEVFEFFYSNLPLSSRNRDFSYLYDDILA